MGLQQKKDKANFLIENQQKYNGKSCKWLTLHTRPTGRMHNIEGGLQDARERILCEYLKFHIHLRMYAVLCVCVELNQVQTLADGYHVVMTPACCTAPNIYLILRLYTYIYRRISFGHIALMTERAGMVATAVDTFPLRFICVSAIHRSWHMRPTCWRLFSVFFCCLSF